MSKIKLYQLKNIKDCKFKAYISQFNFKTFDNKSKIIRNIYKNIIQEYDFVKLDEEQLKNIILEKLDDKFFLTKQEKEVEINIILKHLIRYIEYENRLHRKILNKKIYGVVPIGERYIEVNADIVLENRDSIELIKYKVGSPKLSYKAKNKENLPENNMELYLIKELGKKIYSKFNKPVVASFYHFKGKGDEKEVYEQFLEDKTVLYNRLEVLKSTIGADKKEQKAIDKDRKKIEDVLYFNNSIGGNIISYNYDTNLSKEVEELANEELSFDSEKCNSGECEFCNYSTLCKHERKEKEELEEVKELKKSSGDVKLTESQKEVVNIEEGTYRVNAVAGSGKCIKGDSYIYTNKGMIQIQDIPKHYNIREGNGCEAIVRSIDLNESKIINDETSNYFNMGLSETISATTSQGYKLEGTPEHPIIVLNKDGNLEFKKLMDINEDDIVAISRNNDLWGNIDNGYEISYLLGVLIGDGSLNGMNSKKPTYRLSYSKSDLYIAEKVNNILYSIGVKEVIGYKKRGQTKGIEWHFKNEEIWRYLKDLGLTMTTSEHKKIPHTISQGTRENAKAFLQGLFDTDGCCYKTRNIEYCTKSKNLAIQIHLLLLNFGIVSRLKPRLNKKYPNNTYWYIYISGNNARKFNNSIGFRYDLKNKNNLTELCSKTSNENIDILYYQSNRFRSVRKNCNKKDYYNGHIGKIDNGEDSMFLTDYTRRAEYSRNPTMKALKKVKNIIDFESDDIRYMEGLLENFFFDKIKTIKKDESIVYDFTVPKTHSFVSNGFVSHNTTTMVMRAIELFKKGYKAEDILMITFTNKGCQELKEKIRYWLDYYKIKGINTKRLNIYTFNSFGGEIISKEWERLGFKKEPKLASMIDINDVIKDLLSEYDNISWLNYKNPLINFPHVKGAFKQLLIYFNLIKSFNYDEETFCREVLLKEGLELDEVLKKSSIVFELYNKFNEKLKEKQLLQYQDQILYLTELFKKYIELIDTYGYKHVVIDEFQDTNISQIKLLHLLEEYKDLKSLMAVGDSSQSIFSFMNATPKNIINFHKEFNNTKDIFLVDNFRSTPQICNTANKLDRLNIQRIDKDIISRKKDGELPQLLKFKTLDDEYKYIANLIEERMEYGIPRHEICFIVRTKKELLELQKYLNEKSIPNIIEVSELYIDNTSVQTIINLANFFKNNEYDYYLAEYLYIVDKLGSMTLGDTQEAIDGFKNKIIEEFEQLEDEESKINYFYGLIDCIGEQDSVAKSFIENLRKEIFYTFNELLNYLHKVVLYKDDTAIEKEEDKKYNAVVLTTAHSSKGKEWTVVINSINKYKYADIKDNLDELEEERRLLFTSITRAKDELYVTYNTSEDKSRNKGKYCLFVDELEDVNRVEL